jgi:type IV fimbrial biogenesis protein FimT
MKRSRQWAAGLAVAWRAGGFTTIELLVVIAIAAILAMVGAPSFSTFLNNSKLSATSSQLLNELNMARSEAVKRNSRVLVCVRNAAGTDCGTTTNWGAGWLVCYDNETESTPGNGIADGKCDVAPANGSNPNPIVLQPALSNSLTLTGSAAAIRFNPNGSQGAGGAAATLLVGLTSATSTRTVSVAATGNITKQ